MGINSPQSDEENDMSKFELETLPPKAFEKMSVPELHEIWRRNHEKIKELLKENPPQFFALHGTSQDAFKSKKRTKTCEAEIATFYEKEYDSEQFIYKLYDATLYVYEYANRRNQLGQIMIFNLENDGENSTKALQWENLKPCTSMRMGFNCDSDKESKYLSTLNKDTNLLWRTHLSLRSNEFTERFAGTIDLNNNKIKQYMPEKEDRDYGIIIMRFRFLAQAILAQILQTLATTAPCPK